jgi:ribosomal protein L16 Arg81 hydroxylase
VEITLAESIVRTAVKRKKVTLDRQRFKQRRDSESPSSANSSLLYSRRSETSACDISSMNDVSFSRQLLSSHVEASDKTDRLRQMLDRELNESRSFETYLKSVMDNHGSSVTVVPADSHLSLTRDVSGHDESNSEKFDRSAFSISNELSLTDQLDRLNAAVNSERNADKLFEMQLMNVLMS